MTQQEFTEYAISRLLNHFPQFAGACTSKPDNIANIDYPSSHRKLILRLTNQGKELTVGFAANA